MRPPETLQRVKYSTVCHICPQTTFCKAVDHGPRKLYLWQLGALAEAASMQLPTTRFKVSDLEDVCGRKGIGMAGLVRFTNQTRATSP
jgi:hypothetical protein